MKKFASTLWGYIRYYRFNSILLRNFILIMLLINIPLIAISAYVYTHNDSNMRGEIERSAYNELARTQDSVDLIMAEMESFSVRIKADPDVALFLSKELSKPLSYDDATRILRIEHILQMVLITNPYIDSVFIYSELNDYLLTVGARSDGQNPYYMWWPKMHEQQKQTPNLWITGEVPSMNEQLLSIVNGRPTYTETSEYRGIVTINLDVSAFRGLVEGKNTERSLYIVNDQNQIIYNRDREKLNKNFVDINPEYAGLIDRDVRSTIVDQHEQNYVFSYIPSKVLNGWSYTSISSLQLYQSETSRVVELMIFMLSFSFFTSIILAFIIAVRSYSPIRQIMSLIETKKNPFILLSSNTPPSRQWNETGYILSNLQESFDQSHSAASELQEKYELLRKAQAIALQAQINPHFLYNTLESINWKVMRLTNGKNDASQMIVSLSTLLRLTLETENDLVPISKELEHVKLYLEMQQFRYKDKLEYSIFVDDKLADYKIVKLVLQPIVENAIYYGIKKSEITGSITIRIFLRGGNIVIRVRDNGVGIPSQLVAELNASFKHNHLQENKHIGLRNVNQRLRLAFGEQYGISIKSKQGAGTIVELVIPKLSESSI